MQSSNPFAKKTGYLQIKEKFQKILLFLGTYSIIAITLWMFWVIIARGAPVLQQYGWDFITRKPETLQVMAFDSGDKLEIPEDSFKTLKTYNPDEELITNVKDITKSFPHVDFKIEPNSVISDTYLSNIEKDNDFRPKYQERLKDAEVGFTVSKDSIILLTPEIYTQVTESSPVIAKLPTNDLEAEETTFKVTFDAKECKMQAKTMVALSSTNLVYQLYGNLTDTADDKPDELMDLSIPKKQVITLTPEQHTIFLADTGTGKFAAGEEITAKIPKKFFKLPKGDYQLPLNVLDLIVSNNPNAQIRHFHELTKGSILLDLDEPTETLRLAKEDFDLMKLDNPGLLLTDVKDVDVDFKYKEFSFSKAAEVKLPISDMAAFKLANEGSVNENGQARLKQLSEHSYPYSGGGISGPIWGTALLVIACMIIGLFVGVAAAVFLGEYSKQGGLIGVIRLSMMNLAGVPSIVFGLFGLGLFVSLAPKITDTPKIDETKTRIALFPSFSEPDLRTQEERSISIIGDVENDEQFKQEVMAAQQQGKKLYYDGWYYFSFEGWGNSILAGAFTLAIMVLPIIITSSEESLRAVPKGFREASLALGATKWQSIRTAVLPYATPGILTASVLGITRVAGETAPIMFTAAVAAKSDLPINGLTGTGLNKFFDFISQSVQAMPYHIYTVSGKLPPSHHIKPMQYGSVLVFMIIVMTFAALSVWLRIRMRKKYKW